MRTALQKKESANKERREAEFTRLKDGCKSIAIKNLLNTEPSHTAPIDPECYLDYGVFPESNVNGEFAYAAKPGTDKFSWGKQLR